MLESAITATGRAITLESGGVRAEIGTVAAVLRGLTVGGVAVTEPVPATAPPPQGCGLVLVPWPNRVRDGRWTLDGAVQQLDLTEPARGNAIHGLLRNTEYTVLERSADAVTLGALIPPQHGWPFPLGTTVRYALRPDGLAVTHGVVNHADRPAPWAVGAHPSLRVGAHPIEELVLTLYAGTRFEADERMNPGAEHPVAGTGFDLRGGVRVGELDLDTACGELAPRAGVAALLSAPDGAAVELLTGPGWGYAQVFTPRIFPRAGVRGLAVAVEPMTAPPNALNSGRGLVRLAPGERAERSWGLRYTAAG